MSHDAIANTFRSYEIPYGKMEPIQFAIPIYKGQISGNIYGGPTYVALSAYGSMNIHNLMHFFISGHIQKLRIGTGQSMDMQFTYSNELQSHTEITDDRDPTAFMLAYGFYPKALRGKTITRYTTRVVVDTTVPQLILLKKEIQNDTCYEPGSAVFESAEICGYFLQHAGDLYSGTSNVIMPDMGDVNREWMLGHYPPFPSE